MSSMPDEIDYAKKRRRRPVQSGRHLDTTSGKFKMPRRSEPPYFKFLADYRRLNDDQMEALQDGHD